MTTYADDHASALLDVTDAGAAVTFTDTVPGVYDPSTDTWSSPTTVTIAGYAVQQALSPDVYAALGLTESKTVTVFFVPTTYGDTPSLGMTFSWNSVTYTAKSVSPVAPDGTTIGVTVIGSL